MVGLACLLWFINARRIWEVLIFIHTAPFPFHVSYLITLSYFFLLGCFPFWSWGSLGKQSWALKVDWTAWQSPETRLFHRWWERRTEWDRWHPWRVNWRHCTSSISHSPALLSPLSSRAGLRTPLDSFGCSRSILRFSGSSEPSLSFSQLCLTLLARSGRFLCILYPWRTSPSAWLRYHRSIACVTSSPRPANTFVLCARSATKAGCSFPPQSAHSCSPCWCRPADMPLIYWGFVFASPSSAWHRTLQLRKSLQSCNPLL